MRIRRLMVTAVACVVLVACGSGDGEAPDLSLPSTVTLPDRSTTVPPGGVTTTETPTTETPTTETPTTETPTTETPTTETPTTETATTETPTTETPTTETAATETPTTEAAASPPADSSDDAATWWPWLLAGAALLGLIVFLVMRRSRRVAAWRDDTAAALDQATRLATHLAAVAPEGAAMVAAQDAGPLADLAARLSVLGTKAPDEAQRLAIEAVHHQVQALHGVVDGIAMGSGPVSPAATDHLREQATALHGVAAQARATVLPTGPDAGGAASA